MSPTITLARLTGDSSCFIFKRVMPIKKCALPLLLQQRESESAFLGRSCKEPVLMALFRGELLPSCSL